MNDCEKCVEMRELVKKLREFNSMFKRGNAALVGLVESLREENTKLESFLGNNARLLNKCQDKRADLEGQLHYCTDWLEENKRVHLRDGDRFLPKSKKVLGVE